MFVIVISDYYLLKNREMLLARRRILLSVIIGLLSSLLVIYTGDSSAKALAKVQPVKFAAFEALYEGKQNAGLVAAGILKESDKKIGNTAVNDFVFRTEIPGFLSIMTSGKRDAFVPGIYDLVNGNQSREIMPVSEKIERGSKVRSMLEEYKTARKNGDNGKAEMLAGMFRDKKFNDENFRYFGYSFFKSPDEAIPNVKVAFYTFHLMVMLGFLFILEFFLAIYFLFRGTLEKQIWFLWTAVCSILLPYVAGELGWVLAEMGRQPWIIQDLMPVSAAVSQLSSGSVITTFVLFAVLFTLLLVAEVSIMIRQIKIGPKH
jgi:cytochrome d ubiquinol oxidase subunit I